MQDFTKLKIGIIHYWFLNQRGGERVVEALCDLFPQADLFALVADQKVLSPALLKHKLTTSFLQKFPGSLRWHRYMLPLYPFAVEQFDLRAYDLVISSESGPAKGILTRPETCHICYCHTPMRYLWDFYQEYKNESGLGYLQKLAFAFTAHYARMWDYISAARVDYFAANSRNVANRIQRLYGRQAEVIYPPVNVLPIVPDRPRGDHYLAVGQLVSYKRFDLAIEASNKLGRQLRIVGEGEEYKRLRRLAGKTVRLLGQLNDEEVREQYATCRALLFPGEEDFGIVPVEAQAAGTPVIAFGRGGARETVIGISELPERTTGVFFPEQSVDSLARAILKYEGMEQRFSSRFIRDHASQFDKRYFNENIVRFVTEKLENHQQLLNGPYGLDTCVVAGQVIF